MCWTYFLLELLMYGIECIFNRHTFQVPCRDLQAQREVQIDLLDRGGREQLLEEIFVLNTCRRGVEFPEMWLELACTRRFFVS
jgi:hypothetical protein